MTRDELFRAWVLANAIPFRIVPFVGPTSGEYAYRVYEQPWGYIDLPLPIGYRNVWN